MLAHYFARLGHPVRYAAPDPAHLAAVHNYLSMMTRAHDLPGHLDTLTQRRVVPQSLHAQLLEHLLNPQHPADLAMGGDQLENAGLTGKTPTPGRRYGGFDAPERGSLLDALFYHLHGLAGQGMAALGNANHPILRDFNPARTFGQYSREPQEHARIATDALSSLSRVLRAMPQTHPLYAPIHALYMADRHHGLPDHPANMLMHGYDLSRQAELLGQQHGGGYTRTEDSMGDLDWTGRHARTEAAAGLGRLADSLRGLRLQRGGA